MNVSFGGVLIQLSITWQGVAYLGESEIKRRAKGIPMVGQLHGSRGQKGAKLLQHRRESK